METRNTEKVDAHVHRTNNENCKQVITTMTVVVDEYEDEDQMFS